MKNRIINCIYFIFLFLSFLSVSGCSDLNVPEVPDVEQGFCVVKGDVGQENSISRQASPVFVSSKYSYIIKAFQGDDENNSVEVTTNERSFVMKLRYGTWNFRAIVKYDGKEILTGLVSGKVINSETENISFSKFSYFLGAGTVKLQIKKGSGSTASKILCVWNDDVNEYTQTVSAGGIFNMIDDLRKFSADGKIPSGYYKVRFYIKDSAGNNKGIFIENITVYSGQVTTRFLETSMNYINSLGQIELTSEIETPVRNNYHVSSDGKEYGTGSKSSPLKTIQNAIDIIEAVNDGVSKYTITIISPIKAGENEGNLVSALDSVKVLAVINPSKKLNLDILGEGNLISGENNLLRGFYIGKNAEVNFNNIIIQDFYTAVKGCEAYITGNCILSGSSRLGHTYLSSNSSIKLDSSYNFSDTAMKNELFLEEFDGQYQTGSQILKGAVSAETKQNFTVRMSPDGSIYFINDSGILEKGPENVISLTPDAYGNFCISNRKELEFVRDKINDDANIQGTQSARTASYILTDDIDLMNEEWEGIGTYAYISFEGTFDGNNHSIKNLCLKDQNNNGLFRYLKDAEIKNIKNITGNSVMTKSTTGGVAAVCAGGKVVIRNVCSSVNISSSSDDIGGFVGELSMTGTELLILNCINRGNITSNSNAGGFIGNVFATNSNIIKIYNSANFGNIEITSETGVVGGLIGKLQSDSVEVINAYNSGIITGLTFQKLKNDEYVNVINAGNLFGVVSLNIENNSFVNYFYYYEERAIKIIGDDSSCGYHIQAETLPIREVFENQTLKSPVAIDGTEYSSLLSALNCPYIQTVISGRNPGENYSTKTWTLDSESKIVLVE